jgi:hypothetical protein
VPGRFRGVGSMCTQHATPPRPLRLTYRVALAPARLHKSTHETGPNAAFSALSAQVRRRLVGSMWGSKTSCSIGDLRLLLLSQPVDQEVAEGDR